VLRQSFYFHMKRKFGSITDPHDVGAMSTVQLNPRERQLKALLLDVAAYIDKDADNSREPLVLRWAGGWVRDKLLGIQSHDIDTAINCMTGFAFASKMRDFCEIPENVEKHSIGPTDIGNLHKIAQNPEKSKHLETVTTKVFGFDVDFVNLRKETYAEDSRNPQMEFGTAQEDALRRDATVNALFYNLHSGEVEDLTGGLRDMDQKLIRTPMEPFQTFMDDPLRVLRLVRFASRLEFSIDPAAEKVMGDERVLNALRLKISRERVGIELEKMLKGELDTEIMPLSAKCSHRPSDRKPPLRGVGPDRPAGPSSLHIHGPCSCRDVSAGYYELERSVQLPGQTGSPEDTRLHSRHTHQDG